MKKLIYSLLLAASFIAGLWYFTYYKPHRDFERLLTGNKQIVIIALSIIEPYTVMDNGVEIDAHRIITFDDPITVGYLTKAFRSAWPTSFGLYTHYHAYVYLSNGSRVRCTISFSRDKHTISVSYPVPEIIPDSTVHFLVELPNPMPEELSRVFAELRK